MGKGCTYFGHASAYEDALGCFDCAAEVAPAHVAVSADSDTGESEEKASREEDGLFAGIVGRPASLAAGHANHVDNPAERSTVISGRGR